MLKKTKLGVLKLLYKTKALIYKLKGIKVGKDAFISGFPWFYKKKGAQIIIGDRVTLHSKRRFNTLITNAVSINSTIQ